jgi:SAM-dependent methyltransferase
MNEGSPVSGLVSAVVAVWREVLGVDVTPASEFAELCADLPTAARVAALLNQSLDSELGITDLYRAGTPDRVAATMAAAGVHPPPAIPAVASDDAAGWRKFWETTYRFAHRDTAGWIDSRSLTALPGPQMREWADTTTARLLDLAPRSVLDVGCGVGLILSRLAPHCRRYVAFDFAEAAVRRLRATVAADPALAHVEVAQADALDGVRSATGRFDVVLLNSVVQYFPDLAYLRAVLAAADADIVFLGDLRDPDLHRAMHVAAAAASADDNTPAEHVRLMADQVMAVDSPLLVSPRDLSTVTDRSCRALLRRGIEPTEMNRFRYDALLCANDPAPAPDTTVVLRGVHHARNHAAVVLADAVRTAPPGRTIGAIRHDLPTVPATDPETIWTQGHTAGFGVAVAPGDRPGYLDIALHRGGGDHAAGSRLAIR